MCGQNGMSTKFPRGHSKMSHMSTFFLNEYSIINTVSDQIKPLRLNKTNIQE